MKKLMIIALMFLSGCISKPTKMNELDYSEYEWRKIQMCERQKSTLTSWSDLPLECKQAEVFINKVECRKNWKLECAFLSTRAQ